MANQTVSGKVVVAATINELKAIQVPVDLLDTWGPHLARAFNNLRLLYNAMEDNEKKPEPEEAAEESPDILIAEGGNENAEEKDQLEGTVQEQGMAD